MKLRNLIVTGVVTGVVIIGLCLLSAVAPAHASEGDSALSISLGYGTYAIPDHRPDGGVLGVEYERGISDALSLRLAGAGGLYVGDGQTSYSGQLVAGMTYLFDVIKYVPYASAGVGGIVIAGGEDGSRLSALVELSVGLEVLHSRRFSYGVQLRAETFIQETSSFAAGVRATYHWGFF